MKPSLLSDPPKWFARTLLKWNSRENKRVMPWKGEKDPYKIWLSEVILQQTRVEQGWNYYNRFVKEFPTIRHLAKAKDETVFKLWEGLGYYSRCKNLLHTARYITENYKGQFPETYSEIVELKGVGPYTAAAIASFAFNLPYAVVDGNVFRVLARIFGIETPIDTTEGKRFFTKLAEQLIDPQNPALYNQAIMDFGATVCKPLAPLCMQCPFQEHCTAFSNNTEVRLPVKVKKIQRKERWLHYFIFLHKGKCWVRKRTDKDIWENLHEFVLVEYDHEADSRELQGNPLFRETGIRISSKGLLLSERFQQQLTHQTINARFAVITASQPPKLPEGYRAVSLKSLTTLAFPKIITSYLAQNRLHLE